MPANSVNLAELSAESVTLLAVVLLKLLGFDGALIVLHKYFGGQLKAKCPFFLYFKHVALDIHSGIEGGRFFSLSGKFESVCPVR